MSEAYLYDHSQLVAFTHDTGPITTEVDGKRTYRVTQRALVTVEGIDYERLRYLADYQSGRLQSGSFRVEDFVEDEQAARHAVGLDTPSDEITLADALAYAANALDSEEVEYALGLDADHVHSFTTITVDGVERPYTETDLANDVAKHRKIVELLREAALNASYGTR